MQPPKKEGLVCKCSWHLCHYLIPAKSAGPHDMARNWGKRQDSPSFPGTGRQNRQRRVSMLHPRGHGTSVDRAALWRFRQDVPPGFCSPHWAKQTRDWCKIYFSAFHNICRLSAHSPDLNHMDYSVWLVLETRAYAKPQNSWSC